MDQEKIGKFIRKIRTDYNLTQRELADKLGVTYQAVSKWENGKNIPDIALLKMISKEFNVDINEILEGEKKEQETSNKKVYYIAVTIILIIICIVSLIIISKNNSSFEFKTISSKCSDFKLNGSAAYNKEKTAIYISSIEFCGQEDNSIYKDISCTLYENYDNNKKEISNCKKEKSKSLKEYLKEIKINVDNYATSCKKLTSNTLSLEIKAVNEDNKTITYTIPIKLDETCK